MKTLFNLPIVILFIAFSFTILERGQCQEIGGNLSFSKLNQDIGNIAHHEDPIDCTFEFINTGSIPVAIEKVNAPCGCTVPDYSPGYIQPGEKNKITVTVHPDRIPSGSFKRGLTIITKPDDNKYNLFVDGIILPKFEEIYRLDLGAVRLKSQNIRFGEIIKGGTKTISTGMINVSSHPVHLSFEKLPGFITMKSEPAILNPDEKGQLHITFNTSKTDNWGLIADSACITINNDKSQHEKIRYIVIIKENFDALPAKKQKDAPKISFNRTSYNLGKIPRDTVIIKKFIFRNEGKRKLIIRDFMNYCEYMNVVCKNKKLRPGKEGKIEITYTPGEKDQCKRATITVISNDPKNPWVKLKINSIVDSR